MTTEKLRYAQHLMADKKLSIPEICKELGGLPSSTLDHYLHADGTLKEPGRVLMGIMGKQPPEAISTNV